MEQDFNGDLFDDVDVNSMSGTGFQSVFFK